MDIIGYFKRQPGAHHLCYSESTVLGGMGPNIPIYYAGCRYLLKLAVGRRIPIGYFVLFALRPRHVYLLPCPPLCRSCTNTNHFHPQVEDKDNENDNQL